MSPTNEVKWSAWKCVERGNCYVLPSRANPADPRDIRLDTFPDRETAKAYCDEINEGRLTDEGLENASYGLGTVQPILPSETGSTAGSVVRPDWPEGETQARPPAQTEGQTTWPGMTPVASVRSDSDYWRGMLITDIPQVIADRIDDAGQVFESLQTIVNSNIGLVLGRCRQGIASCRQAVFDLASPIVASSKNVRQLVVDTVTLEIQNKMGSAMTAFSTMQPVGSAPTPTGASLGGPWVVWGTPYGPYPGKTCAYVRLESEGPTHTGDYILSWFADQSAAIVYASQFNINSGCSPAPPPIPIPVPPPPTPPPIGSPPPPTPPTGPPPIGPDCCPIPSCPGFVKAPPNTYYGVVKADGTHDNITLTSPPAAIVWLPYGVYYQLPCHVPRNMETDPAGLECLPLQAYDPCRPGRNVRGLWRPNNTIDCVIIETIPIRGIIAEKRLTEIYGQIFFGESFNSDASSYLDDYARYQICPKSPIPVAGGPPGTTPTTPPTTPSPTPPTIPPASPPGLAPLPPLVPIATESKYCDNLKQLRDAFAGIGLYMISDKVIDPEWVRTIDQVMANSDEYLWKNFQAVIREVKNNQFYKAIYDNVWAAASYYKFVTADYVHLLACRRLFEWLESLKSDASYNTVGEAATEGSAAPQIFGIGGGGSWKSSWVGTMALSGSVKFSITPLIRSLDRCIAYSCPEEIPSIGDAIQLYLTNNIDLDHCECLVRFNGGVWDEYKLLIQARRQRADGLQSVMLYNRGLLTPQQLRDKLRDLGYIDQIEQDEIVELAKWIPGPSDLIRFMMRDTEDPQVVQDYQLEAEFPDKFQGLLEQQATSQGVSRETMLQYWKAHWQFPSATQLYEMLHRLRPDNVPAGTAPADWIVDEALVKKTLGINDVSPYWRDKLVAISYRPLTRVDARRAFNVGKLDKDGLVSNLRDQGYHERNANVLADFFEVLRLQSFRTNRWVKYYINGGLDSGNLRKYLEQEGVDVPLQDAVINDAGKTQVANAQQQCVKSIHSRYLAGEFTAAEVVLVLQAVGTDQLQSQILANGWECERDARAKHLSASSLCKYYERGLITAQQFIDRLMRIGYGAEDAGLIIQECTIRIIERQTKAAEQLAKQTAAAQEKIAKEREKIAKAIKAAKDKEQKAKDAIAKSQRRQQDQFTKAAARYARVKGIDTTDAANEMSAASLYGNGSYGLSAEEATELAIELANAWKARDNESFSTAYDDMLRARGNAIAAITAQ